MTARVEHCYVCGRHRDVVGPLSRRHKCAACALAAMVTASDQMRSGAGEYYERWRATAGPNGRPKKAEGGSGGAATEGGS